MLNRPASGWEPSVVGQTLQRATDTKVSTGASHDTGSEIGRENGARARYARVPIDGSVWMQSNRVQPRPGYRMTDRGAAVSPVAGEGQRDRVPARERRPRPDGRTDVRRAQV